MKKRIGAILLLLCAVWLLWQTHWVQSLVQAGAPVLPEQVFVPLVHNTCPAVLPELGAEAIHFAAIGDYGTGTAVEHTVATMVKNWQPDFIITMGDNNYPSGAAATIDQNIGQDYSEYIVPYTGSYTQPVTTTNRFFPSLGNHDWVTANAQPYLDYFTLDSDPHNSGSSGTERYYDFVWGLVHFFVLDSDPHEPDGIGVTSDQALWLQTQMSASSAPWQVVYFHHPPYSSGWHGNASSLQWPFAAWGADAVLAGHEHSYERLDVSDIPYFVNGSGGASLRPFLSVVDGSQVRFHDDYGAMLITADNTYIDFRFYAVANGGTLVDAFTLFANGTGCPGLMPAAK